MGAVEGYVLLPSHSLFFGLFLRGENGNHGVVLESLQFILTKYWRRGFCLAFRKDWCPHLNLFLIRFDLNNSREFQRLSPPSHIFGRAGGINDLEPLVILILHNENDFS